MSEIREDNDEIKAPRSGVAWFAVSYSIFDHPVVGPDVTSPSPADPSKHAWHPFMAWLWLIREASRHERSITIGSQRIPLMRGQVAVSQRYLGRRFNWTYKAVRRFIERLAKHDMVCPSVSTALPEKGAGKGAGQGAGITLLTITKYDVYQCAMADRGAGRGAGRGAARAQLGRSKGAKAYRDTEKTEKTEESSSIQSNRIDDDRAKHVQLSPSIIETLKRHVGQQRGEELATQWRDSRYGRNAQLPDRAFIKWLQKTYGVVISGAGDAAFKPADALGLCPTDERGQPVTALPKVVTPGAASNWRALGSTVRRMNGRGH